METVTKEIKLDILPIYENEKFPTVKDIWHYETERIELKDKIIDLNERKAHEQIHLERMMHEIKRSFCDADAIVIIRNAIVIKVISNKKVEN